MNARSDTPRDDRGHFNDVRTSPIAGTWYPGAKKALEETVDDFLAHAPFYPTDDDLFALISPHAGYPYSGQTAACAFRQLVGRQYDVVVLLGPSHYDNFGPLAVTAKKYYETPLGQVELAQDFISAFADRVSIVRVERDREHSLEIQLPFLQRVLLSGPLVDRPRKAFQLVPIMVMMPFYLFGAEMLEPCEQVAAVLADLSQDRRILFVASSDLSHLPDYAAVEKFDARTAELVESLDLSELAQYMWESGECRACGDAPILIALLTAKKLGADRVRMLYRTNSGEVTGMRVPGQYTVGYMAAAVYKSKSENRN
jgi:AmmeMemoRadiSam system protein B